jgi:hypothetical protein
MRRAMLLLAFATIWVAVAASPAFAVSGAGYTTVNTAVDGSNHCKNGNPGVNCNIYDGKQFVWLNGGPAAGGLGPDGEYFFAVLAPGGQPNPNDGGAKNLSDDFDAYTNRTFTVTNGEVSAYAGTHDNTIPLIRLAPYADTTNPGGVYIMAICSLAGGVPVAPADCKYDAFKVKSGAGKVQAVLSGQKYFDSNANGKLDSGESGLSGWEVQIVGSDGTNVTVTTNASGAWSYTTGAHNPSAGTTTYTIFEHQQSPYTQTGNTVDQSVAAGGASVSLASFVYTVAVPNNAISAVEMLNFGNFLVCPPPVFGTDATGHGTVSVTVQYPLTGLASIVVTYLSNATVSIPAFAVGTTSPVTVSATQIDTSVGFALAFNAIDTQGNVTACDPVASTLVRESGVSSKQTFGGLDQAEGRVAIYNGTPGVRSVTLNVNGTTFRISKLRDGEVRTVDISSAMRPGTNNVVSAVARGQPGTTASIVISN